MKALDSYAWTGHSAIMGSVERSWQDTAMVLRQFGRKVTDAKRAYQAFVADGIEQGRRSELVGGGLVRSIGGWSEVLSMKRSGQRERSDERILGSGAFVEQILKEAEEGVRRQLSPDNEKRVIEKVKAAVCRQRCVGRREIEKGNRRREVAAARAEIVLQLVKEEGISMAVTARAVGVSTSAVSKLMTKNRS